MRISAPDGMKNLPLPASGLSRLLLLLAALAGLTGLLWWRSTSSQQGMPYQQRVDSITLLSLDDYLMSDDDHLHDEAGNVKLGTVLLPVVPQPVTAPADPLSGGYLGPESCAECHADYYHPYIETSHFKTSREASIETILGSFSPSHSRVETRSPQLHFEVSAEEDKLVQRVMLQVHGETYASDFPFHLVTGSGKVGQTYLYWDDQHLYQMHLSYSSSLETWTNSPGYVDGTADYARPIVALCLDCHTTYFEQVPGTINQYQPDNYILGISCEKCHGPGRDHVAYHRANPDDSEPRSIVNPAGLSVERAREICQACHGGMPTQMVQQPFSFRPGEQLEKFYLFDADQQPEGVHSNSQLPRLQASSCFQNSPDMTCTTCHNPHQFERGDIQLFSQRCMDCHESQQCGLAARLGARIEENCIDCHMPSRDLQDIVIQAEGGSLAPRMRDHLIQVWEDASELHLQQLDQEP